MLTFCFVIILLSTFTSVATSKSVIKLTDAESIDSHHLSQIFYLNELGNILFIDFDVIEDDLNKIIVLRGNSILKSEDISELPSNIIYELELDAFKADNYTIELVTNNKTKIKKQIAIN